MQCYIFLFILLLTYILLPFLYFLLRFKVVLAHPFDYKDINHKQYIQDIYNLGILDGIECLHTRHGIEQIEYIKNFCLKNNLLITGGSDFHREQKQTLGYGANGTIPITEEYCLKNYTQIEVHER